MLEIIGLILLAIWIAKKARDSGKNSYTWGLISVGIYFLFYMVIYLLVAKGFQQIFARPNDQKVATYIFSLGLIAICFSISSSLTLWLMRRQTK